MTMPSSIADPMVQHFCATYSLTDTPVILSYHNVGYDPIQCHINAKIHAINNSGKRVHGWAVWQMPTEFIGEFHSVWEDSNGTLSDVTPSRFGGQTMFIRDRLMDIYTTPKGDFVLQSDRVLTPSPHFRNPTGTPLQVWGLSAANPDLVSYCGKVGMNVAALETDTTHG